MASHQSTGVLQTMCNNLTALRYEFSSSPLIPKQPLAPWELEPLPRLEIEASPKKFCPIIKRPERRSPKLFNVPPPNFSVPPPPIQVRFSVPPPPINPSGFKPVVVDTDEWIEEIPSEESMARPVDKPHDYEIGFWFGVPIEPKSILEKAKGQPLPSCRKTKRNVKFSDDTKVAFVKNCDDDYFGYKECRPTSCTIPEKYPYPNFPSADVIRALNQQPLQANRIPRFEAIRNKNLRQCTRNYQNLIAVV